MEAYLYEVMKRATVFLVLAQIIIGLRPAAGYEKYLKFLAGIMTVVILLFPVLELIPGKRELSYSAFLEKQEEKMQEMKSMSAEIEKEMSFGSTPENTYLSTMENEIKSKLYEIAGKAGYFVETVEIQGISGETTEGKEKDFSVKILLKPENSGISTVEVDKVKLQGDTDRLETQEKKKEETDWEIEKQIEEALGLETGQVEVDVLE